RHGEQPRQAAGDGVVEGVAGAWVRDPVGVDRRPVQRQAQDQHDRPGGHQDPVADPELADVQPCPPRSASDRSRAAAGRQGTGGGGGAGGGGARRSTLAAGRAGGAGGAPARLWLAAAGGGPGRPGGRRGRPVERRVDAPDQVVLLVGVVAEVVLVLFVLVVE